MNDPSEVSYASGVLISLLERRIRDGLGEVKSERALQAVDLLQRSYLDPHSFRQYREDRSFITSFSRSDESLTLWRMYSGKNGYSVGFDEDTLQKWIGHDYPNGSSDGLNGGDRERHRALVANHGLESRVQDVSYGDAQLEALTDEILSASSDGNSFAQESRLRNALKVLSGVKHVAFSDEREARMVLQEVGHHAADPNIRVSADGGLVAYRKIEFPFEAVRSIAIAPSANVPQTRHALDSLPRTGGRGAWGHVEIREFDAPFVW